MINDPTVVRLHASLATKFPATRSRKVAAGIKVDALLSVCANGPTSVALVGERTHDIKTLRLGPWVKGRILIANLGYYSHRHFAKIAEYGGFFDSRLKASADPHFVSSLKVHPGLAIDPEGKRLSEVLPHLRREVMDAEVEPSFKHRTYNGRRSGNTFVCRLVAVWDEKWEYHACLTNISPERLTAQEVTELYRLRWEIELLWRGFKSSYALDKIQRAKAVVVEALIWSALLTPAASSRLHNLVRARQPTELRSRYTPIRCGKAFRRSARDALALKLTHLGLDTRMDRRRYTRLVSLQLTRMALDPHVTRHRPRDAWSVRMRLLN